MLVDTLELVTEFMKYKFKMLVDTLELVTEFMKYKCKFW